MTDSAPAAGRPATRRPDAGPQAALRARAAQLAFDRVDPASPLARDAVGRYFAEIGRRFGFTPSDEPDEDARLLIPPAGAFIVAVSGSVPVACGGLHTIAPGIGELKRMWVHDDWRGAGLGSRLLRHLEGLSRDFGHRALRLDTNGALTEAIAMYQRAGYHRIDRYNDNPWPTHFFEKPLTKSSNS